MRKARTVEGRRCPKCGDEQNQTNYGFNKSGTQKCRCKCCKRIYTLNPKTNAYPEEIRNSAMKTYFSGVSGRCVGKIFGMSKANIYNWLKKTERAVDK